MFVRVRLPSSPLRDPRRGLSDRHDETPVLHAFQTDQSAGEFFHLGRSSVNDKDFEARFVIEVGVACGDNEVMVGVLESGQFIRDAMRMVVVDQSDGTHHDGLRACGSLGNEAIADQIAEGFGTVGISQTRDEMIESLKQIRIEGNSDSTENTHDVSFRNEQYRKMEE